MKEYLDINNLQIFQGRNIYCHRPVIKLVISISEEYIDIPTKDIEDFNDKITGLLPGLDKHKCSLGYEGGFLKRLEEGTYLPHVTEHIIIELQNVLGYEISYGKTRRIKDSNQYYVIYCYEQDKVAIECAHLAIRLVNHLINKQSFDLKDEIVKLKKLDGICKMGPSTKAIYDEARKRGIPVTRLGDDSLLQLGYGKYRRIIQAAMTDSLSCISADIAANKQLTKCMLSTYNLPVADGELVFSIDSAINAAKKIGFPIVVKPYDANQGKGVSLNISDNEQIEYAFILAQKFSKGVIIEKYICGKDYRLLVIGGKFVAAAQRIPPFIVGNGQKTIRELVIEVNMNKLRGDGHENTLTKIPLDEICEKYLSKNNMTFDYIPDNEQIVYLRENSNLSTGGTALNCTEKVHPYNISVAEKAAEILNMEIAGIDIIAETIEEPINSSNGVILEVNAAPGLRMHLKPSVGDSVNVAKCIVDILFPQDKPCSIPIVSVTGTNGKTTTVRFIKHALSLMGLRVGMTCTSGTFFGEECVLKGDNTGASSAKLILENPTIEAAVLETARGGIIKKGLGYDLADVAIITNISEDHLGIDGIETQEDLASVKALVIEAVKPDGYAIINADDSKAEYLISRARSNIVLFSKHKNNRLLQNHLLSGGMGVCIEDDVVVIYEKQNIEEFISVNEIALTMGGLLECNIENSLAAIGALKCLRVPDALIKQALQDFKPDIKSNPGRFNIFNVMDYKVMLDYGHNIAGYESAINYLKCIEAGRRVGIIGMPGDRQDSSIKQIGQVCAHAFEKIIIKEDNDLRDRNAGEVADILFDAVVQEGFDEKSVEIIYSETNSLIYALETAQPGDMIAMFYEELEPLVNIIKEYTSKSELKQNTVELANNQESRIVS